MDSVGIAFDGMTIRPATFGHIRLMFPALKAVFPQEVREMEIKRRNYRTNNFQDTIFTTLLKNELSF
jgi:hypothetical protein